MVMEEVFEKLRALQDVLAEKIALEREIQDIPKLLLTQEELLARLKKSFIDKNQEYEAVRSNVVALRGALAEAESSREKAEKHMDAISTQREYEALDKEIREASEREQQYRKDLQREDKVFAELDEQQKRDAALIEQQETELTEKRAGVEQEIEQQETELTEKRAGVEQEIAGKTSECDALVEKERSITPGLDPEVLFKFERIIRSKLGLGIVAIKGGVCTGCHMILPAQFANMVRSGEDIVFCPYCSRILFFQEAEQGEQDFFDEEDAGSLADLDDLDGEDEEEFEEDADEGEEEKSEMDFEE